MHSRFNPISPAALEPAPRDSAIFSWAVQNSPVKAPSLVHDAGHCARRGANQFYRTAQDMKVQLCSTVPAPPHSVRAFLGRVLPAAPKSEPPSRLGADRRLSTKPVVGPTLDSGRASDYGRGMPYARGLIRTTTGTAGGEFENRSRAGNST